MESSLSTLQLLHRLQLTILERLHAEMAEAGYGDVRDSHGCVFGHVEPDGSRLTELANRAGITKQSVGEAVDDLERLGYVERVPDPKDGRAKIVQLTDRGRAAQETARGVFADIEAEWAERYGAERVSELRETLFELSGAGELVGV